jgi:hypothetical protein
VGSLRQVHQVGAFLHPQSIVAHHREKTIGENTYEKVLDTTPFYGLNWRHIILDNII